MIALEAFRAAYDRGDLTWWTVSIYGRGQGVVLAEMRAVHRALATWDVSRLRTLRVTATTAAPEESSFAWPPGLHPMTFNSADDLALLAHDGYASFQAAQAAAITHYSANSRVISAATADHVAENMTVIAQLLAVQP